ncbi:hypothetical protein NNJEOMEG_01803 [Fundidesulfovibrio magnetotacticus]|uniref:Major facilitator superfamily (MFS) profile domain-containing protein n=1 Tax=Fundidesulfovibrio magnetotacticus TaxID=2730080 RepID=A0A6V8M0G9_9BACT|nr:MFS transporter [Fundidesulfovibrio magnetotacticus]GFK93965.1 hypothetical protein NNJEOMEG_01803 [Fundidesulfovibrio magnetotacticus]
MTSAKGREPLFTADFLGLCCIIFLAYCNHTVFYSLDVHLARLGIEPGWRGLLIGASSLSTIAAYLALSPSTTTANASRRACAGAVLLMACGSAYLAAADPWSILAVRLANGLGVYLLSASAMTLLVERIPPGRSAQAFGMYSIAMLLPYCVVPAVFDALFARAGTLAQGYMAMSLCLAPALVVAPIIGRRAGACRHAPPAPVGYRAMARGAARPPVAAVLGVCALYITVFSAVFFLAKAYFQTLGVPEVGAFFVVQMACIILVRLAASHRFDRIRKMWLIGFCFGLSGVSCVLAATASGLPQLLAAAAVMGLGMGAGSPAMNALMVAVSEPRMRGVNSNLATMAMQAGSFTGPLVGTAAVHAFGPAGFLWLGAAICAAGLALCLAAMRLDLDRGDPARD